MEARLEYYEDHIYSVLAAKLIAGLKPEDIKLIMAYGEVPNVRAPNWEAYNANLFSLLCLLSCNYIKSLNLDDTNPEYLAIIGNIAAVSGLFQREDKPLPFHDVERMMRKEFIPVDWDAKKSAGGDDDVEEPEPPAPRYLSMQRYLDLAYLAESVRSHYEGEVGIGRGEDGLDALLDSAEDTIQRLRERREHWRRLAQQRETASKAPPIGRTQFEL